MLKSARSQMSRITMYGRVQTASHGQLSSASPQIASSVLDLRYLSLYKGYSDTDMKSFSGEFKFPKLIPSEEYNFSHLMPFLQGEYQRLLNLQGRLRAGSRKNVHQLESSTMILGRLPNSSRC